MDHVAFTKVKAQIILSLKGCFEAKAGIAAAEARDEAFHARTGKLTTLGMVGTRYWNDLEKHENALMNLILKLPDKDKDTDLFVTVLDKYNDGKSYEDCLMALT